MRVCARPCVCLENVLRDSQIYITRTGFAYLLEHEAVMILYDIAKSVG
jgi:hypothetical protein